MTPSFGDAVTQKLVERGHLRMEVAAQLGGQFRFDRRSVAGVGAVERLPDRRDRLTLDRSRWRRARSASWEADLAAAAARALRGVAAGMRRFRWVA